MTWRLNGANVLEVVGVYDSGANTLSFSGLAISVADSGSQTYTLSGYYSTPTGLTDNATYILSVNGNTDLTVDSAKTQMGITTPVTNGTGTKVDITATKLIFRSQPSNVALASPTLANATAQTYTEDTVITALAFINSGGAVASCSSSPTLPTGLSLAVNSSGTCEITGMPTAVMTQATTYTVTATNVTGNATATVSITVNNGGTPI